jgi:hypothetical protein
VGGWALAASGPGGVRGVSDRRAVCSGRPKAEPNLGPKWVTYGLFVCLGSLAGSSFTYFLSARIRSDAP